MKNVLKRMLPYVMLNALIYSIAGAIIGKNYAKIKNTKKIIERDEEALKKFMKDMVNTCPNKMKLDDLENEDDSKDPIDPTVIYVYD